MSFDVELPAANSDAIEHADWIELDAIRSQDGSSSYENLVTQIHISGTTDVMWEEDDDFTDGDDGGGELSSEVADRAWAEIERRQNACGNDSGFYPFEVTEGSVTLRGSWKSYSYVFQLLLWKFGRCAGPDGTFGERIFEHLSSHAGKSYMGGNDNEAEFFRFGFPRPDHTGFATAITNLCGKLNCGSVKKSPQLIGQQQDSHLDVVVWRPFPDRKESQLRTWR